MQTARDKTINWWSCTRPYVYISSHLHYTPFSWWIVIFSRYRSFLEYNRGRSSKARFPRSPAELATAATGIPRLPLQVVQRHYLKVFQDMWSPSSLVLKGEKLKQRWGEQLPEKQQFKVSARTEGKIEVMLLNVLVFKSISSKCKKRESHLLQLHFNIQTCAIFKQWRIKFVCNESCLSCVHNYPWLRASLLNP